MTALVPFRPTVTPDHQTPTTCFCCGRSAVGVGFGSFKRGQDPLFLCELCLPMIENIRTIMKWDRYELAAIDGAVEFAGEYLERIGKSDLSEFEADEADGLVREIILGFGATLRRAIASNAPF